MVLFWGIGEIGMKIWPHVMHTGRDCLTFGMFFFDCMIFITVKISTLSNLSFFNMKLTKQNNNKLRGKAADQNHVLYLKYTNMWNSCH